ncbi:hypothetical protein PG987_010004 [Apiospora arundinis]
MEELTEGVRALAVTPPDSSSAGDNGTEGFTSEDGTQGDLTDIFARNPEDVAISLNEHLRWSRFRCRRDPFISWTTSMAFAIHYAMYKSKEERLGLEEIMLCVIDTTRYPPGTFMQDLVLLRIFENSVCGHRAITVYGSKTTWNEKGLGDFLDLRTKRKRRGVYYFGEYLSQGRTCVTQSCSNTVHMDKIINADVFKIAPQLQAELESTAKGRFERSRCAEAVLELREDFRKQYDPSTHLNGEQRDAGYRIACQFSGSFTFAILVNLLSLRPFWADRTIGTAILECDPDRVREFCLQPTRVVADDTVPEVQQFQMNILSIHEACYKDAMKTMWWLSRLEDLADKVVRDAGELKRKLEEIRHVTGDSV